MKLIPMGEYYVWHCDWCDSTNYILWSRLDEENLSCAACHQHLVQPGVTSIDNHLPRAKRHQHGSAGFAC